MCRSATDHPVLARSGPQLAMLYFPESWQLHLDVASAVEHPLADSAVIGLAIAVVVLLCLLDPSFKVECLL
jgi:hypothetical protein